MTVPTSPPNPARAVVANMLPASSEARPRAKVRFMRDIEFP
jgi:hypothetical protein